MCAPVYSIILGLRTEVTIGPPEGLKHPGAIHCDRLVSIEKQKLTSFVGALAPARLDELRHALREALDVI